MPEEMGPPPYLGLELTIHVIKSQISSRETFPLNFISRPLKPMDDAAKRRTIGGATDGAASFTSKLSLLLIFPLIESQTR